MHGVPSEPAIEVCFRLDYAGFCLDVDLALAGRGITALFGPSGSGKTTLLRCIAGLARGAKGRLRVNGAVWQDDSAHILVPTHRRSIGVVFQEPSLFQHLSVQKNLEFGLRRSRSATPGEFDSVVDLLDIRALLGRMPAHLSGGERQRVAIGRALLVRPALLLMDEPLSSLDAPRKLEILPYLERLRDELDIPVLYVSHSIDEVARLADHLVLLESGKVTVSGPLAPTLARLDLPTAALDDAGAVIEAVVGAEDERYHLTRLDFRGGSFWLGHVGRPLGARVRARIPARDVSVALALPVGTSILNVLPATLIEISDTGADRVNLQLDIGSAGTLILARITRRSRDSLGLVPGLQVYVQVKSVALM
jgi:molybdate transport system ATP-binding protein